MAASSGEGFQFIETGIEGPPVAGINAPPLVAGAGPAPPVGPGSGSGPLVVVVSGSGSGSGLASPLLPGSSSASPLLPGSGSASPLGPGSGSAPSLAGEGSAPPTDSSKLDDRILAVATWSGSLASAGLMSLEWLFKDWKQELSSRQDFILRLMVVLLLLSLFSATCVIVASVFITSWQDVRRFGATFAVGLLFVAILLGFGLMPF